MTLRYPGIRRWRVNEHADLVATRRGWYLAVEVHPRRLFDSFCTASLDREAVRALFKLMAGSGQ